MVKPNFVFSDLSNEQKVTVCLNFIRLKPYGNWVLQQKT